MILEPDWHAFLEQLIVSFFVIHSLLSSGPFPLFVCVCAIIAGLQERSHVRELLPAGRGGRHAQEDSQNDAKTVVRC